jgi:hypothetical protein
LEEEEDDDDEEEDAKKQSPSPSCIVIAFRLRANALIYFIFDFLMFSVSEDSTYHSRKTHDQNL